MPKTTRNRSSPAFRNAKEGPSCATRLPRSNARALREPSPAQHVGSKRWNEQGVGYDSFENQVGVVSMRRGSGTPEREIQRRNAPAFLVSCIVRSWHLSKCSDVSIYLPCFGDACTSDFKYIRRFESDASVRRFQRLCIRTLVSSSARTCHQAILCVDQSMTCMSCGRLPRASLRLAFIRTRFACTNPSSANLTRRFST